MVVWQEVDVRQQEIILRDSLAVYGKGLGEDTCTIADMGSWSMGMHMTTAFSVGLNISCCFQSGCMLSLLYLHTQHMTQWMQ